MCADFVRLFSAFFKFYKLTDNCSHFTVSVFSQIRDLSLSPALRLIRHRAARGADRRADGRCVDSTLERRPVTRDAGAPPPPGGPGAGRRGDAPRGIPEIRL